MVGENKILFVLFIILLPNKLLNTLKWLNVNIITSRKLKKALQFIIVVITNITVESTNFFFILNFFEIFC